MKKLFAVALALMLLLGVFSGCTLVEDDNSDVIVAKVNDVNILMSDYELACNYYINMLSQYGYDAQSAMEYINSTMKDTILKEVVVNEVLRQKAEAEGYFNYNDEHHKAAEEYINDEKQAYIDQFVESYKTSLAGQELKGKNEGESNEDYLKRIAADRFAADYEYYYSTTIDDLRNDKLEADALDRFKADKLKDVTVTDSEVESSYSELLASQKEAFTTDKNFVTAYKGQSITLDSGSSVTFDTIVYNRAGYSKAQHILINFTEEDSTKLSTISSQLSSYDSEIETRKKYVEEETDEQKKAEEQALLDEAQKQRDELQEQYDIALSEAKAKIQAKVDEVYNAVKDGDEAKFIEVMIENTEDTGMADEESAKKGYLVGPEDGWVEEFSTAAKALEAGQISEPVASVYGYHIIRCSEKITEGEVGLDNVKDEIKDNMVEEKKTSEWSKMVEMWYSDAEPNIKMYPDRI